MKWQSEKYKEIEKLEQSLKDKLSEIKTELVEAVRNQEPYGDYHNDTMYIIVKSSHLTTSDNWTAEFYLPEKQAEAAEKAFGQCDTISALSEKLYDILTSEKRPFVRMSGAAGDLVFFNNRSLEAMRDTQFGQYALLEHCRKKEKQNG